MNLGPLVPNPCEPQWGLCIKHPCLEPQSFELQVCDQQNQIDDPNPLVTVVNSEGEWELILPGSHLNAIVWALCSVSRHVIQLLIFDFVVKKEEV